MPTQWDVNLKDGVYLSVLQCVAVCCSLLQSVAVCCSLLQSVAVCCGVFEFGVVYCSPRRWANTIGCQLEGRGLSQSVAVRRSLLQSVAVGCSPQEDGPTQWDVKLKEGALQMFEKWLHSEFPEQCNTLQTLQNTRVST